MFYLENELDIQKLTDNWINHVDCGQCENIPKVASESSHIFWKLDEKQKSKRCSWQIKNILNGLQKLYNITTQYFNSSNSADALQNYSDALLNSTIENPLPPYSRITVSSNPNKYAHMCTYLGNRGRTPDLRRNYVDNLFEVISVVECPLYACNHNSARWF